MTTGRSKATFIPAAAHPSPYNSGLLHVFPLNGQSQTAVFLDIKLYIFHSLFRLSRLCKSNITNPERIKTKS
ncbi:hypothetical protein HMPREF9135_2304 [Segatella baroniae F0067]|uniref:Uncharacterized protein n=1 Tax=Segatella baroniae F0067 TaxID=1115809 RepID=U2QL81_9BACT|nr:hypothetical protein HMPREF9135_2304 [Segatella baroniae F0067]